MMWDIQKKEKKRKRLKWWEEILQFLYAATSKLFK